MRSDFSLNTIRQGKENARRTLHIRRKRELYKNYRKKRHLQRKNNKTKQKRRRQLLGNCVWLSERMHIEERRTVERRATASVKTKRRKRNKHNLRRHDIRPEDTSSRHLWLIKYGERTSTSPLALGYPLRGPSRHVRAYYCML